MKKAALLLIPLIISFLTGCWDRIDIENRAFILGVAIDKYPPIPQESEQDEAEYSPPKEEEKLEMMELHTRKPRYAMTVQIPILKKARTSNIGTGGGVSEGGGDESSATWEITQVGNSFFSMNQEILSRTNLTPFYEHLQVIIISEDIAREGLEEVLDFFLRDPELRRRVKVFISKGQAKTVLDVKPRIEDFSSLYLAKLPMNAARNPRMIYKNDLNEFINNIHEGYDFALPRVEATKDEIKASGGAVFRKNKMVGWLSELELEALKFIRNLYLGGMIVIEAPESESGIITLEITKSNTNITAVTDEEYPRFDINIKVEGYYAEEENIHTHGRLDSKFLESVEKRWAKEIERLCKETVKKVQQEYNADIFHFSHILKTEKPDYWKQAKEQWYSIFPNIEIDVKAEVDIILTGIIK